MTLPHQPDDPGIALCPCCRRPWPDEDGDLEKLIRNNIRRGVSLADIARAFGTSLAHAQRVVAKAEPPIDLRYPPESENEPEPRGA